MNRPGGSRYDDRASTVCRNLPGKQRLGELSDAMPTLRRWAILAVTLRAVGGCQCGANNLREAQPSMTIGTELDFGPVLEGTQKTQPVVVGNEGGAPLTIISTSIATGSSVFNVASAPSQIQENETAQIVVAYSPTGAGPDQGSLVVTTDDPKNTTATVTLKGGPNAPQATLSPSPLSFVPALTSPETKTADVKSTGLSTLHVTEILITAGTNPDFSVAPITLPASVAPGSQLSVSVIYARTQQHTANGQLEVHSDDPTGVRYLTLIPDPIAPCTTTANCTGGKVCIGGICAPCTADAQCPTGETCNNGLCAACMGVCAPGQMSSQACGNCGTQTRTCDATCQWGAYGSCSNEGTCMPNASQACNMYGTQTCTAACAWGACSCPQAPACTPNMTQTCGNCGTQTCDACGQWGTCTEQDGGCVPNLTQACNSYGTQTCDSACGWGPCSCPTGATCAPTAIQACNGFGTKTCTAACAWGACSCPSGSSCAPGDTQACNNFGTQTCAAGTCTWGACSCGAGAVCAPTATQACNVNGTQTCTAACAWGACSCPTGGCGVDAGTPPDGGCDPNGVYGADSGIPGGTFTYTCCLGEVDLNLSQFALSTSGTTLTVTPGPGFLVNGGVQGAPIPGASTTCPSGSFSVSETYSGGCNETYAVTGTFTGPNTWTGTFTASYSGSECDCFMVDTPCTNQTFNFNAIR
jgi:hypothetical protein